MKKNLYQSYLNKIAETVGAEGKTRTFSDNLSDIKGYFEKGERALNLLNEGAIGDVQQETGLHDLAKLLGLKVVTPTLGDHPDFTHISKTFTPEYHYATSVFQDIKGSTSLFKKYTNEQVYSIVQMISVATTHTHALFFGHIQRLQYDGVFSYFVRKDMAPKLATLYSLMATSFATYFIRYELRNFLSAEFGLDKLYTKTGVDYGSKDEVMWVPYGVTGCCEVSTNSLHTSLTFKIQGKAASDHIYVGSNITQLLPELKKYYVTIPDNIIYEDSKRGAYRLHGFDWEQFLLDLFSDFVKRDGNKLQIDYDYNPLTVDRIAKLRWNTILAMVGLGAINNTGSFVEADFKSEKQIPIPTNSFYGES